MTGIAAGPQPESVPPATAARAKRAMESQSRNASPSKVWQETISLF